jgi:cyclohexanecarboxylate-CoA ligase
MSKRTEAELLMRNAPSGESWYDLGYYRAETLGRRVARNMESWGDLPLRFLSPSRPSSTTLREAWEKGRRVASALADLGLGPGDRIAIQLPSWEECIVAYLACFHAGITIVPIVTIFGAKELSFILQDSGARTLLCAATYRGKDFAAIAKGLSDEGLLDTVILVGGADDGFGESWDRFIARADGPAEAGPNDPDAVAFILYTSGTTSNPKGARHTHNTFGAEFESEAYAHQKDARALSLYPAGHTAGTLNLMRCFFVPEANYVLTEWNAEQAVRVIDAEKITRVSVTPFYLTEMMEVADRTGLKLSSIRQLGIGGTTVDPTLVERGMSYGIVITRSYGSTEHPTISVSNPDDPGQKRISTDGRVVKGNVVRLVDDDGVDVAIGQEGEILSTGPELFAGYTDPKINATSFVDEIWFRTGDVARFDVDGYLTITDRKKDIVIRGGENISAREVEEALRTHSSIEDAAVVPYPDPKLGERVCAFLVLNPGATFALDDALAHFVGLGLAKQKTPERLETIDVLPRTAIGKVNKSVLKALLQTRLEPTA